MNVPNFFNYDLEIPNEMFLNEPIENNLLNIDLAPSIPDFDLSFFEEPKSDIFQQYDFDYYLGQYHNKIIESLNEKDSVDDSSSESSEPKKRRLNRWTMNEKNQLIQIIKQLIEHGNYTIGNVGKLFCEKYPERTQNSVYYFTQKLIEDGEFIIPAGKEKGTKRWTEAEKQELIRITNQLIDDGKFNFQEMEEKFSRLHPNRTYHSIYNFVQKLLEKGEIVIPVRDKGKRLKESIKVIEKNASRTLENCEQKTTNSTVIVQQDNVEQQREDGRMWTEAEKLQLIELAQVLIEQGQFTYDLLGTCFSVRNPKRSADAASRCAIRLVEQGKITIPIEACQQAGKPWTEDEKQQLIQLMNVMVAEGKFSFRRLGIEYALQHPERTKQAAFNYARRLAASGEMVIPPQNGSESNNSLTEVEIRIPNHRHIDQPLSDGQQVNEPAKNVKEGNTTKMSMPKTIEIHDAAYQIAESIVKSNKLEQSKIFLPLEELSMDKHQFSNIETEIMSQETQKALIPEPNATNSQSVDHCSHESMSTDEVQKKLMRKYNAWTDEEKQQLIQMANEIRHEGKINYAHLGQLFCKKYPSRSAETVRRYASRFFKNLERKASNPGTIDATN